MIKTILFNESEEFYEFAFVEDAARFLGVELECLVCNLDPDEKINNYYIEREEDKIVQYNRNIPVKIWNSITEAANKLLIHEQVINKSLNKNCVEQIHFKWFSHTNGKKFYG